MRNLIFFVIYLLLNPRFLKPFLKGVYLPVYIQYEWMKDLKIATVIDVGAYQGRVTKSLNYLFPDAAIFAFEPSNEILKIRKNRKITIIQKAVGKKKTKAYLHKTTFSPASSLLSLNKLYRQSLGKYLDIEEKIAVDVITLDSYFKDRNLKRAILLKIDTQGTEGEILMGAQKLLREVDIIHIESPFKELYKNQSFFQDLYNILTKKGFRYIGDIPDGSFYPEFVPPEVVNCIYVNEKSFNSKLFGKLLQDRFQKDN